MVKGAFLVKVVLASLFVLMCDGQHCKVKDWLEMNQTLEDNYLYY